VEELHRDKEKYIFGAFVDEYSPTAKTVLPEANADKLHL
jgi:hypothetical protein